MSNCMYRYLHISIIEYEHIHVVVAATMVSFVSFNTEENMLFNVQA